MAADEDADVQRLRQRLTRYNEAGLLGKAAMRLTGEVPGSRQREAVRRRTLGVEGRIAEDVRRAVRASDQVWELLAEKDLPEDVSLRELDDIAEHLLGRRPRGAQDSAQLSISLKSSERLAPLHVTVVRAVLPGELDEGEPDAYRYATLTSPQNGASEPFLVALQQLGSGRNRVLATMLLEATFLRHERDFGVVDPAGLEALEDVVRLDLREIRRTQRLLPGL